MARLVFALAFLAVGFASGFIVKGLLLQGASDNRLVESSTALSQNSVEETHSKPSPFLSANSNERSNKNKEATDVADENPDEAAETKELSASALEKFQSLILQGRYTEAVDYYQQKEREGSPLRATFKRELLKFLDHQLKTGEYTPFLGMTEAWLNTWFKDLDVLLLLAEYNASQAYYGEAISIYQLLFSYSDRDGDQARVQRAFISFVHQRDALLLNRQAWFELQNFYEMVDQVGLASDDMLFRLAEVYVHNGQTGDAIWVAQRVVKNPRYREKAEQLLAIIESGNYESRPLLSIDSQTLKLERHGHHYIANVVFPNNVRLRLILDTGATLSVISKDTQIEKLGYNGYLFMPDRMFNTANGVVRGEVMQVPALFMGSFELKKMDIAVLPQSFGENIDGLLGMNVLSQFRFHLDQEKAELILDKMN